MNTIVVVAVVCVLVVVAISLFGIHAQWFPNPFKKPSLPPSSPSSGGSSSGGSSSGGSSGQEKPLPTTVFETNKAVVKNYANRAVSKGKTTNASNARACYDALATGDWASIHYNPLYKPNCSMLTSSSINSRGDINSDPYAHSFFNGAVPEVQSIKYYIDWVESGKVVCNGLSCEEKSS